MRGEFSIKLMLVMIESGVTISYNWFERQSLRRRNLWINPFLLIIYLFHWLPGLLEWPSVAVADIYSLTSFLIKPIKIQ
jgi:hypothetical membrane protein